MDNDIEALGRALGAGIDGGSLVTRQAWLGVDGIYQPSSVVYTLRQVDDSGYDGYPTRDIIAFATRQQRDDYVNRHMFKIVERQFVKFEKSNDRMYRRSDKFYTLYNIVNAFGHHSTYDTLDEASAALTRCNELRGAARLPVGWEYGELPLNPTGEVDEYV